jgi:polysaccharide transporter, PST family
MNATPSLGSAARKGAAYTGMSQAIQVVVTMVSAIVVSRLLSPVDYGIQAMTLPVANFLILFQGLGLSQAAIQSSKLTQEQSSGLFWINGLAGIIVGLILVAISPLVGLFYGDMRVAYLTAAFAVPTVLSGFVAQHSALLNRHLRFRALAYIDIVNAVSSFIFTLGLALWLRNYWALVIGTSLGTMLAGVLTIWASGWRPNWRISFAGTGNLMRFGGSMTGFNVLNFLSRNADDVLIGKVWGAAVLGLYNRSYKLMMFPILNINQPLSRVMLPILSRLDDNPAEFRRVYLMVLRAIALVAIPGIAVAGALSDQLVPLLLGKKWVAAGPIFAWLSLAAIQQPITNTTGWLFMSTGRAKALMHWGVVGSVTTVTGFAVGVRYGAEGVAIACFAVAFLRLPLLINWSSKDTSVSQGDLYGVIVPVYVASAAAWGLTALLERELGFGPALLLGLASAYAMAVLFQGVTPTGREGMRHVTIAMIRFLPERLHPRAAG